MTYCIPYIVFLFVMVFTLMIPEEVGIKGTKTLYTHFFLLSFFILFFCFRGYISTDWSNYINMFKSTPSIFDSDFSGYLEKTAVEKGNYFFWATIKRFTSNYFVLQFLSSLIDIFILNSFFKKFINSRYYVLGFVFFFLFNGIVIEVNLIRNSKAIMLFCLSMKYIDKKKDFLKYLLCNVIGSLFHISGLIYIPLYFLLKLKYKKATLLFLFFLGNFFYIFQIHWLTGILIFIFNVAGQSRIALLIESYGILTNTALGASLGIGFLERTFTYLFLMHFQSRCEKKNPNVHYFFNLVYFFILTYLFTSEFFILTQRISILLSVGYWIAFPAIYGCLNKKQKYLFLIVVLGYGSLKMLSMTKNDATWNYTNILITQPDETYSRQVLKNHLKEIGNEYVKK